MPNRNFEVLPYPLHMCVIFKNCLKYESNKFVSNMLWNITLNIRARNLSCNLAAIITRHSFVKVDNILFKTYRIWFQSTSLDYVEFFILLILLVPPDRVALQSRTYEKYKSEKISIFEACRLPRFFILIWSSF